LILELFRTNQRVEEIQAKPDRDGQSEDRLRHGAAPLELPEGVRVNAHQRQENNAGRHECYVEHSRLLIGALLTAEPRKLSIWNWAAQYKDIIVKRARRRFAIAACERLARRIVTQGETARATVSRRSEGLRGIHELAIDG
jgi:hypothetical protein